MLVLSNQVKQKIDGNKIQKMFDGNKLHTKWKKIEVVFMTPVNGAGEKNKILQIKRQLVG